MRETLEKNLWVTVGSLEETAKKYFASTPALPMDGNWITSEHGTFNANKRTAEFVRAFKRQSKGAKFLPFFNKPNTPYEYVYVYYEGETFPRGVIGFGTWGSVKDDGRLRYTIVSRRIANNKFTNDKPQHLMVATEKLDVAISNANTYLLQHNPLEIGKHFREDIARHQEVDVDLADSNLREARVISLFGKHGYNRLEVSELNRITDQLVSATLPALDVYLSGQAESDRKPEDVTWYENIKMVAERKKEYAQAANRCKVTWCVYVQVKDRGPTYKAARIPHVKHNGVWTVPVPSLNLMWEDKNVTLTTWVAEHEVPAWLLGKMAVADTLNTNQYVPNVGYKVATNVFYIEELESDTAP
jgi:hypothetical protein